MYAAYKDKAEFFLIYIREAHPTDARPGVDGRPGDPSRGQPDVKQAKSVDERAIAAGRCEKDLKLTLPIIIDDMQGTAEKAYGGWPDRIAVIDIAGRIAHHSGPGPGGFNLPAAERALKAVLANGGKWTPPAPPKDSGEAKP